MDDNKFLMEKDGFIVNNIGLTIAVNHLANFTRQSPQAWISLITKQAGEQCDSLSQQEKDLFIQNYLQLSESLNNESSPDPAWDYYETWQLLHRMKQIAESGIALIADKENADRETDAKLKQAIEPLLTQLEESIDDLSADTILHVE
ncbi:hypothetical protein [Anabaena azotica]|uniref:Uncharacterized protein n=1 Tax=Anabaena azotica FACHB-119 TaxID=947527 RepID=A0ABR8DA08_9NOST|nr:hypothetical protein [Anabaena azotica]MBD2503150.1 hypothetical protein [Anabaena azotica FACHB-119]